MEYFLNGLKQYAEFSGRTARLDYWMYGLINLLIMLVLELIFGSMVSGVYSLAVLLPTLAICVRRLHDIDHSAWWILVILIPFIGFIVLFVFVMMKGTPSENRFGPNPEVTEGRSATASGKITLLIIGLVITVFVLTAISTKKTMDEVSQTVSSANGSAMNDIHSQVSDDAVKSYELSVKGGDPIETCVQAGLVVAAYNQAHDEANYLHWKSVERSRCAAAGISH